MLPDDRRFIVPTWVRSLASLERRAPQGRDWRAVDRILDTAGTEVQVLVTGNAIHAWAAGTSSLVHYAYVPPELRREGLARRCITALLGGYPERIAITTAWPFASARYCLQPMRTAA